jgi:glycine cleavage system H protein
MLVPDDLRYSAEHEWVRVEGDEVVVGITDFAQDSLGDVVFVSVPAVGSVVRAGASVAEVESTKSVSDIYAPVSGRVVAANDALDARPELVNEDPYGAGWIFRVAPSEPAQIEGLLDAGAYRALVEG